MFSKLKKKSSMLFLIIFISSILAISCNSWIMVWIFMEINTLTLCSYSLNEMKSMQINKPILIYFLTQILASIIFLMSVLTMKNSVMVCFTATLCLLMKMGVWPVHLWYMKTLNEMEFSLKSMKMIMTWQKLIPIFFISFFNTKSILILISMMSMLTPLSKTSKKTNFNNIIILSSMNNNGWLILSKLSSLCMFTLFYTIYSLSIIASMNFLKKNNKNKSLSSNFLWNSFMVILNILSMPPSMMFFSKLVIIMTIIPILSLNMLVYMMFTSCYFSFFYLKTTFLNLSHLPMKSQMMKMTEKKMIPFMISFFSIMSPLMLFWLD